MKNHFLPSIVLACILTSNWCSARLNIPQLPAPGSSYFSNSHVYTAQVKQGSGDWQTLHIRRTSSQNELVSGNNGGIYKNREFHFTPFSFDSNGGSLKIRVTKDAQKIPEAIAANLSNVEIVNAHSNPIKISNHTLEFTLNTPQYVFVNFNVKSNQNTHKEISVIKHPFAIFADPYNSDLNEPLAAPGQKKLVYNASTTFREMQDADIIVFRGGFHDIKNHDANGTIPLNNNKIIWLHPRALVTGHIERDGQVGNDALIYGRGVLYQGDFRNDPNNVSSGPYWQPNSAWKTAPQARMFDAVTMGDRATLRGVIIADTMHHGVVSRNNSVIERVKIWGWHGNNDAFRPGDGSMIKNNFIRAVDDALYSRAIKVENNLFYHSYNGAILTCGWENVGDSGNTTFNNNIIYRPEWTGLGNNNGILASQIGPYAECKNITFNNTKIYGKLPGLINLKQSSRLNNAKFNPDTHKGNPGLRNFKFKNTTVYGELTAKSLIAPSNNIKIQNVVFEKFKITGFKNGFINNAERKDLFTGSGATNNNVLQIK